MITHGWLSKESTGWLQNLKDAYLKNTECNIINVDWSFLADNPIYPWSAFSTRYVGKIIAKLLRALSKTYQIDEKNIHLIGHSLGAQVMGYAGMFYGKQVNRITGKIFRSYNSIKSPVKTIITQNSKGHVLSQINESLNNHHKNIQNFI